LSKKGEKKMGKWNDMKISKKLVIAFVALIVLTSVIGIVGFNGLSQAAYAAEVQNDANELVKDGLQLRRYEKNFQLRFDQDSIDNFHATVTTFNEHIAEMKTMNLDATMIANLNSIEQEVSTYATAFDTYVTKTQANANEVLPVWTTLGADFNAQITKIRQLTTTGSAIYLQGDKLETTFVLHRVAALYYIKDAQLSNADTRWTAFQTAMQTTKTEATTLVTLSIGNTELTTAATTISNYIDSYVAQANIYHANELVKTEQSTIMVEAGRAIEGSSDSTNTYYGGGELLKALGNQQMQASQTQATTMVFIFIMLSIIIGVILAWTIIRSITKPLTIIGRELKELSDTGDLSKRSSITNKNEVGVMSASINNTLDNIVGSVSNLAKTADDIAQGSKTATIDEKILKQNNDIGKLGQSFAHMLENLEDKTKIGESFLMGMSDPAFKTDTNLVITDINDAALTALGYSREEVVGKMMCSDICKTPVCGTDKCTIKNCIKTKGTIVAETIATARSGTKIPVRAACGWLYNSKGEAVGGFEVVSDLTALHAIVSNVEKVADGDLTVKVEDTYKSRNDSTGTLAKSLDKMVVNVGSLVSNLKQNIDQVASSAEELSSSAEEVNASMEEVSSTIQQVATGSQNTAKDSETMLKQATQAGDSSIKGQQAAKEVSTKMEIIKKTTQEGAQKISALGEKSKEIGHIVDTINQISEQTNLLALNAAIEAARAGEAGRGFAVVADEVRKLAEESGQATQQISSLIQGIQTEIDSAVKSMGENSRQVDEGSKGVEAAVASFELLPEVINAVNKSAQEVGAVAQENASGAEEVSASIQEVTSSMQQVSSAAQQMASIASELKNMVEQFKVDNKSMTSTTQQTQSWEQHKSAPESYHPAHHAKKPGIWEKKPPETPHMMTLGKKSDKTDTPEIKS
jgi:PAS domain S-box-containing protein